MRRRGIVPIPPAVTLSRVDRPRTNPISAPVLPLNGNPTMPVMACLNGELMPVDQARVPIWDRGFLFGDAVYEVSGIYRGRCWLEDEHMGRLGREPARR